MPGPMPEQIELDGAQWGGAGRGRARRGVVQTGRPLLGPAGFFFGPLKNAGLQWGGLQWSFCMKIMNWSIRAKN